MPDPADYMDYRYFPDDVDPAYRPIFDQLDAAFPEWEIWQRMDRFRRSSLWAAAVSRTSCVAVLVSLPRASEQLSPETLQTARTFLATASAPDLYLG